VSSAALGFAFAATLRDRGDLGFQRLSGFG
jgi:hypothetical protein